MGEMTNEEALKRVNEILEKRSPNFFVRPEPIYDVSFWLRIQEALEKAEQKEELLDAISIVVDYNGYQEFVKDLNDIAHTDARDEYGYALNIFPKDVFDNEEYSDVYKAQLQVIWMMMVNEFGDYGTSPRSGWIIKSEEFKKFISELLERVEERWS